MLSHNNDPAYSQLMAFQCLVSLLIRNPAEVEEVLHVLFRNTFELTEAGPGTRSRVWTEWRVLPTATQTVATRNPGKLTVDSLFACQPISEWITFQNHNSNNQFASKMSPKWKTITLQITPWRSSCTWPERDFLVYFLNRRSEAS